MDTDEMKDQNAKPDDETTEPSPETHDTSLLAFNAGFIGLRELAVRTPLTNYSTEQFGNGVEIIGSFMEHTANALSKWASRRLRR